MDNWAAQVLAWVRAQPPTARAAQGAMGTLQRLCAAAATALPASGAGLSVMSEDGLRGLSVASDVTSERVEELQFTFGEGPCMEAFEVRRPVLEADLSGGGMARWPAYSAAAQAEGVGAVFAFPLQVGAARLGVFDLHRADSGPLSTQDIAKALSFADLATSLLLDEQHQSTQSGPPSGLEEEMASSAAVYQAQGMLMIQLKVSLVDALARLRAYAYAHDRTLVAAANDVVARRVQLDRD
jgi:hypothetical protein